MRILEKLDQMGVLSERSLLQLYPPFLFMGVKVLKVADNYRWADVRLPLRWYGSNMHGTMFGGWLAAVSDPFPALLCSKLFKDVVVWTKSQKIEFKRPARTDVHFRVEITDEVHAQILQDLETQGRSAPIVEYHLKDKTGRTVARVKNRPFIALKTAVRKRKLDD